MPTDPTLTLLGRMVGDWTTEATHPAMPGVVVHGTANIEWLEGERFLIIRARTDHPEFPDSIAIIGDTEHDQADKGTGAAPASTGEPALSVHYFDSRGVFRRYDASVDDAAVRWWRDDPGFPQRFTGTFADGGATIVGLSQLREHGGPWKDDLAITYRRRT